MKVQVRRKFGCLRYARCNSNGYHLGKTVLYYCSYIDGLKYMAIETDHRRLGSLQSFVPWTRIPEDIISFYTRLINNAA
jgi:hypothetical protein